MRGKTLAALFALMSFIATSVPSFAADGDSAVPNRPIRDKWALVVGISEFENSKLNLRFSAKDASDFASYLTHEGGFAPDHVKLLLNKDATKRNILSDIGDKWLPHLANPDDLVVIFLSTHGSGSDLDIGGQNYLVAYDTDVTELYATGIPMQQLAHDIKNRVHCDRIIIFLDACHSGATEPGARGLERVGVDASEFSAGSGQMVIASSKEDQISWESKKLSNGVFTAVLLDSLRKQGASASVGQMFSSLRDNVQDTVLRERGFLQTPVLKSQWSGNDVVIAAKPTSPHPGLEAESPSTPSVADMRGNMQPPKKIASPSASPKIESQTSSTPSRSSASSALSTSVSASAPDPISRRILLVPGKSVARMRLGMGTSELLQLLGKPTFSRENVITYWTSDHQYFLSVFSKDNQVQEVAFSSPAFKTEDGISLANFESHKDKFATSHSATGGTVLTMSGGGFKIIETSSPKATIGVVYPLGAVSSSVDWWNSDAQAGSSNSIVVPGASLAKLALSESRAQVLKLLGKPTEENGNHLTYWTKDHKTFLTITLKSDSVGEIVYSSKLFATADGISPANFESAQFANQFLPAKTIIRGAHAYMLKSGGLAFIKRADGKSFGWLYPKGAPGSIAPWTPLDR